MRKIKFRALTANVNDSVNYKSYWVYGLLEKTENKEYPHSINGCFVKPETIGQFVCEHNEKEIYEGDIFHIKNDENKIKFEFRWFGNGFLAKRVDEEAYYNIDVWVADGLEVIGNIHQN